MTVSEDEIKSKLREIAQQYPDNQRADQLEDIGRIAFHIQLVLQRKSTRNVTVADIGGGQGLFSVGCAALGMKAILVDDFGDAANARDGDSLLNIHRSHGVEIVVRDVVKNGVDFPPASLDAVTCFDSIEHWHASPKPVFHSLVKALKPDGVFILGVPNNCNLRKRLTMLLGKTKWSRMEDWYEAPVFRGHVREPDVDDLRYIVRDLGLRNPQIYGRNWIGLRSRSALKRVAATIIDAPLRCRPTLCSDIYLIADRPA